MKKKNGTAASTQKQIGMSNEPAMSV